MRYSRDETIKILGLFTTLDTVTINIYDMDDDSKIVDAVSCVEISTTGVFRYEFIPSVSRSADKREFLYVMSNGTNTQAGKIVVAGFPDDIKDDLNNTDQYKADVSSLAQETSLEDVKTLAESIEEELMQPNFDAIIRILGFHEENSSIDHVSKTFNRKSRIVTTIMAKYANAKDCQDRKNATSEVKLENKYDSNGNWVSSQIIKVT